MPDCTCIVREPQRDSAITSSLSKYAIYLDVWDDETEFDPSCPFHGDDGSMVATPCVRKEAGPGAL